MLDCLILSGIKSGQNQIELQIKICLRAGGQLGDAAKCNIMGVSRKKIPTPDKYDLLS